jgi:regulator of sirC expression with transglutaminase-like and TPR domain
MTNLKLDAGFSGHNIKVWAVAFIVTLLAILVYLPALQNDFVNWDDNLYVYENPHIKSIDFGFFKWMFTTFHATNYWHPLTWLSHAIDYAIWGLSPPGHHLTSIIFHGLNTFFVVLIIIRLINCAKYKSLSPKPCIPGIAPQSGTGKGGEYTPIIAGAITGLLFGIHPLHVESVAWISERKDVLYAFFFLLSILSYLKYTSSELQKQKTFNYFFCLLFFIFSLMSKPMAVTLPVVLLILDIYPLERLNLKSALSNPHLPPFSKEGQGGIKVLIEKIPFIVCSIISSVIIVMAHQGTITALEVYPLSERCLIGARALCFYLIKMLWPTHLAPLYPYPSKISFFLPEYLGASILVLSITAFCIYSWRRQKIWAVVWTYYLVTLLPVLGIIQPGDQAAADRYTYLPGLGLFLVVGLGTSWAWNKFNVSKNILTILIILLISTTCLLSFLTIKQTEIWKDSLTLWNTELKLYPNDVPKAYYNRARVYQKSGNYKQALDDFTKSIELNPYYPSGYIARGLLYGTLGKYQQAIQDFDKAISINPYDSELYYNRGLSHKLLGKYQKATHDFDKAIQLNPQNIDAYINRELCFKKLNSFK